MMATLGQFLAMDHYFLGLACHVYHLEFFSSVTQTSVVYHRWTVLNPCMHLRIVVLRLKVNLFRAAYVMRLLSNG
jgi:hypothetical protein